MMHGFLSPKQKRFSHLSGNSIRFWIQIRKKSKSCKNDCHKWKQAEKYDFHQIQCTLCALSEGKGNKLDTSTPTSTPTPKMKSRNLNIGKLNRSKRKEKKNILKLTRVIFPVDVICCFVVLYETWDVYWTDSSIHIHHLYIESLESWMFMK